MAGLERDLPALRGEQKARGAPDPPPVPFFSFRVLWVYSEIGGAVRRSVATSQNGRPCPPPPGSVVSAAARTTATPTATTAPAGQVDRPGIPCRAGTSGLGVRGGRRSPTATAPGTTDNDPPCRDRTAPAAPATLRSAPVLPCRLDRSIAPCSAKPFGSHDAARDRGMDSDTADPWPSRSHPSRSRQGHVEMALVAT